MHKEIRKTTDGQYTFKDIDAKGQATVPIIPSKYSPEDPVGKYRRIARKREMQEQKTE